MIFRLLCLVVLCISCRAATNTAASTSLTDVTAGYNSSSAGDTLLIPSGTSTWSSGLTISKSIYIIGSGTNNTIINRSGQVFYIDPSGDVPVRISAMKLNIAGFFGGGNYPIQVVSSDTTTNQILSAIRLDHLWIVNGQYCITLNGCNTWGVIDHCLFTGQSMAIQPIGGAPVWSYPRTAGTTNCMVVEDCKFTVDNTVTGISGWDEQETFSSGHGIRLVVRNCTIDWTAYTSGNGLPYEQHGKGGAISTSPPAADELRGPPVVEIYSNTFKVYTTYRMMNIRGGMNLIHDNTFTATVSGGNVINFTEDNYDSSYMGIDQIANTFAYNNTFNGSPIDPVNQDSDDNAYIQQDRDWFAHSPDNHSGIITWSDWDGSHNGTFTGGVAQKFYPYTALVYPHPLVTLQDGGGGGGSTNTFVQSAPGLRARRGR